MVNETGSARGEEKAQLTLGGERADQDRESGDRVPGGEELGSSSPVSWGT